MLEEGEGLVWNDQGNVERGNKDFVMSEFEGFCDEGKNSNFMENCLDDTRRSVLGQEISLTKSSPVVNHSVRTVHVQVMLISSIVTVVQPILHVFLKLLMLELLLLVGFLKFQRNIRTLFCSNFFVAEREMLYITIIFVMCQHFFFYSLHSLAIMSLA